MREKENMGGKTDRIKGRLKEAAGVLTNDKSLQREGKIDRAAGRVKEKTEEVLEGMKEKTEEAVDKIKSRVNRDR